MGKKTEQVQLALRCTLPAPFLTDIMNIRLMSVETQTTDRTKRGGNRIMKKLVAVILTLAMAVSFILPAMAEDTIKIGGIGVLTGPYAMYGVGVQRGVDLYISELNAAGGINGKQVEVLWEDDEGSPDKSANAYNKLTQNDGVCAILGPTLTGASDAVADLAAADGIPMITASATAYYITTDRPSVFRTCFLDPFQGKVMADFTSQELKATKVAAMYKNGDEYSVGLKDAFATEAKALGMEVVAEEASADKDVDYKTQLTNIKNAGAEVIFLAYYGDVASLILTQANELGMFFRSPSGTSICVSSVSAVFNTGTDSPVKAASSTFMLAHSKILASAGTLSPASNEITSPGTRSSLFTWVSCPSRHTLEVEAVISRRAAIASSALLS